MKKLADWIKDNKLVSLLILAAIAWVLYMGFKDGGWWNKSMPAPVKRTDSGSNPVSFPAKCHWWNWMGWGSEKNRDACS